MGYNITATACTRDQDIGTNIEDQARKLPTLAQLIFAACDSCIYCGGKFVG